jgi:hypothetical protein
VASADLNHDGCRDVVANHNNSYSFMSVLLGDCTGKLGPEAQYPGIMASYGFQLGDLNNDSNIDIIRGGVPASVLLGRGDGSFKPPMTIPDANAWNVALADYNHDGKLDLAASYPSPYPLRLSLGNGDGTFRPPVFFAGTPNPNDIETGDFNGDGWADVALSHGPYDAVSVYVNRGDGTFKPPFTASVCSSPRMVALGDFNGDKKLDLAVACINSKGVGVLLGNGDGTLQPVQFLPTGYEPWSLALGDFNGDHHLDIAVDSTDTSAIRVLLGNGDGTFRKPVHVFAGDGGEWFVIATDLNNDHYPDLVAAKFSGTANVLLNDRQWAPPPPPPGPGGSAEPPAPLAADADRVVQPTPAHLHEGDDSDAAAPGNATAIGLAAFARRVQASPDAAEVLGVPLEPFA